MYAAATSSILSPTPQSFFLSHHLPPISFLYRLNFLGFPVTKCCCYGGDIGLSSFYKQRSGIQRRRSRIIVPRARVSPYEILGVSQSATPQDIKRAYRKLALKYHPDVNKEANAQEKFLKIKHAYTTLINSDSRRKYGSESSRASYSTGQTSRKSDRQVEEDFYGLGEFVRDVQITVGDFFKDLQEEYNNWEASASSQGKPKSLWEELGEIGEEFVEFLEKELNISDEDNEESSKNGQRFDFEEGSSTEKSSGNNNSTKNSIEDNIDEIEATLAQLKKDLGLQ
ncbi:PREDICTED: dnaJ homolog subfamily B member 8-like isoform X1 [Camelina sativa]|uniref:DnaJ homolog subfamily B member 8-like isoform X1 n=1 Tax=Camelina sativa TaxID=90675 RepID=A0ABM0XBR8_CAMSA|nr:PREDICTED: dnaJ homolog subfamily B member 8-like isoform X1 [Camelina sativa]